MSNPNEVARFDLHISFNKTGDILESATAYPLERDDGDWVKYSSYQSLELENKELKTKCKNLDSIIGSLDVKDPNACDALLNVQLINQKTIHELKLENKALRDMCGGTQEILQKQMAENKRMREALEKINNEPHDFGAEAQVMREIAKQALEGGKE